MRLGIDARWFFQGPPSGRLVIRNLVRALAERDTEHTIVCFLDRRHRGETFPVVGERIIPCYVWARSGIATNMCVIPWWCRKLGLDACVYQNFVPPLSRTRRIAFVHDVIFESNPEYFSAAERLYFSLLKPVLRSADGVCTVSHSERRRMEQYGYAANKRINVVYNAVEPRFQPRECYPEHHLAAVRERYRLPPSFVLYVGRLNERKNLPNLIRAVQLLGDSKVKLVCVGGYNGKAGDLASQISSEIRTGRLIATGYVDDADLPVIYALADVFCFVSFEEGFGLPPLEAMAAGVPVVVSNRSSLPEVCGKAAEYVDPASPESISQGIRRILSDPRLRGHLRDRGLERSREFTWERSASELIRAVEGVVG